MAALKARDNLKRRVPGQISKTEENFASWLDVLVSDGTIASRRYIEV